jgi:rare lipoprotein A
MRPQLHTRPGRVVLALGAVGFASAGATGTAADAETVVPVAGAAGGALAPLVGQGAVRALSPAAPDVTIWASATRRNLLVGRRLSVHGVLRPVTAPGVIALQVHRANGWVTVTRGRASRSGNYNLGFTPAAPGSIALRVRSSVAGLGAPVVDPLPVVNVYRLAGASWYGPGGSLACGGTLTAGTLGVAHKTLPCGTMVRLHLGNRTVRVPVIDRGPYVSGRDFDLTPATKRALGFGDTGEIWSTR